MSNINSKS